jgi:CelD/BcsL family acetyltransferase involved in cellulose biosynthesis
MKLEVILDPEGFAAIESEWNGMTAGLFDGHPFFSHFWFANYYRDFFAGKPLFVITVRDEGNLVGIFPGVLGRRRLAGIPLKEVRLIAGEHSHVNRILVQPGRDDVVEMMLDRLCQEGIDLVYIEDVPEASPDGSWWREYCRSRRLPLAVRQVRTSPYIPTSGDFENYRGALSKKFREVLNNRLNRINRAGGFEIKTFDERADIDRALADLEAVSAKSWQGEEGSGLFSRPDTNRFYRDLIRHAIEKGYGSVSVLYFDGRPAAFEFHIRHGATEYCLKAEYSQEFDRVSPGAVLDLELIKRAFASETQVYDLLGYADDYKLRWTKSCTRYVRYYIFNRTAAGMAAHALYFRLGDRLRRMKALRKLKRQLEKS